MGAMKNIAIEKANITRYYARVDKDYWTSKNKVEEQVKKLGREMTRRIIMADQADRFVKEFIDKVEEINKANPRCKPLHAYKPDYLPPDIHDIFINVDGVTLIELAWVKD